MTQASGREEEHRAGMGRSGGMSGWMKKKGCASLGYLLQVALWYSQLKKGCRTQILVRSNSIFNFPLTNPFLRWSQCLKTSAAEACLLKGRDAPYLNDVEDHILVETVEDALGHPVVAPGSMNQKQLLQVGKLKRDSDKVQSSLSLRSERHGLSL